MSLLIFHTINSKKGDGMKKVALLSLVSFVLVGWSDDNGGKVTNEFLVGNWGCFNKEYESSYDSKLEEYSDYSELSSTQVIRSYKVVNGVLLMKSTDQEEAEVDLDKIYNNLKTENKANDCEYVLNRNLFKNSSNKHTFEMEMFINCSDDNEGITKSKYKIVQVCTRIK